MDTHFNILKYSSAELQPNIPRIICSSFYGNLSHSLPKGLQVSRLW